MPALALTGTLGSGKSLLLKELADALGKMGFEVRSYSADEENRRLLLEDQEIRREISSSLGDECMDPQGLPDRSKLRDLVTRDSSARDTLERIMHPRLERLWRPVAESHRNMKSSFFIAEIPLLYEKGLSGFFNEILVIGCSDCTRKSRLASGRSISGQQAELWLSIQQSQDQKISLADHLFWNDGTPGSLRKQLSHYLRTLQNP
jgi:dephospho-CoA kinase